jgi:nucleoside-diphosphate-sugar epimerase
MKVLITGSTGFIGKHVIDYLLNLDEIDIIVTSSNYEKLNYLFKSKNVTIIPFDIYNNQNPDLDLFNLFNKPDKVIHLAWKGLPNYNESFHVTDNLIKDFNFIKNLIHNGLKDITITGTCFEYGIIEGELNEDMITSPKNYYALAKDTLRKMLELYQVQNKFNLKWVRLFYLFGFGQNANSLIPQLELALNNNDKYFNMSGGEQIRDYLPVTEAAYNIVNIAFQSQIFGVINNCSGKPQKVVDIIKEYLKNNNKNIKLNLGYYPYSPYEPMSFWGNNQKLKTIQDNESNL